MSAVPSRLRGEQLTLAYGNKTIAESLNVTIPDGHFTAIIGPNGCGKSTLLRTLSRLMTPASGHVWLDGAQIQQYASKEVARRIGVGEPTLLDMVSELTKPGRDPRDELPKPLLRTDVMELKDLKPGMILTGTVRNVTDFGAFVDIAVHEDGLVHISQICDRYIHHPSEALKVGDIVRVRVLEADPQRRRISLSMKGI